MLSLKKNAWILSAILLTLAMLAACGREPAPPAPTRTPLPTFTPTPEGLVIVEPLTQSNEQVAALPQPVESQPGESQPAEAVPVENQPVEEQPVEVVPTDTPAPLPAEIIANSPVNIRQGPGTNYNILGSANAGERFPATGRNDDASWWQIDYNGQAGWLFSDLVTAQNVETVAVAQNIPAPPPPTPPPPTATPVPAQPTAPPAPPKTNYQFNRAVVGRCDPNAGVTYIEGKTYQGSQPKSGYMVAFSYAPDAAPVASIQSGPHTGYEGWDQGFYSHIIGVNGPREGDWYVWVQDETGKRISEIAHIHTDGEAGDGKCQQGIVDFDS